jgi:hypothetical protein
LKFTSQFIDIQGKCNAKEASTDLRSERTQRREFSTQSTI